MRVGSTLISFVWPAQNKPLVQKIAEKNMTLFAMDAIPRISRAQGWLPVSLHDYSPIY